MRTREGPEIELSPSARSELQLVPLSHFASSTTMPGGAVMSPMLLWHCREPPSLCLRCCPFPGSSLCAGNKVRPQANTGPAAVMKGTFWSILCPLPMVFGMGVWWELSTASS